MLDILDAFAELVVCVMFNVPHDVNAFTSNMDAKNKLLNDNDNVKRNNKKMMKLRKKRKLMLMRCNLNSENNNSVHNDIDEHCVHSHDDTSVNNEENYEVSDKDNDIELTSDSDDDSNLLIKKNNYSMYNSAISTNTAFNYADSIHELLVSNWNNHFSRPSSVNSLESGTTTPILYTNSENNNSNNNNHINSTPNTNESSTCENKHSFWFKIVKSPFRNNNNNNNNLNKQQHCIENNNNNSHSDSINTSNNASVNEQNNMTNVNSVQTTPMPSSITSYGTSSSYIQLTEEELTLNKLITHQGHANHLPASALSQLPPPLSTTTINMPRTNNSQLPTSSESSMSLEFSSHENNTTQNKNKQKENYDQHHHQIIQEPLRTLSAFEPYSQINSTTCSTPSSPSSNAAA